MTSPTENAFHPDHYGLFTGPEDAQWIRTMQSTVGASDIGYATTPETRIELVCMLIAERGALTPVFGVGAEIGEEDLDEIRVTIYYYLLTDSGRTQLDSIFASPSRPGETIVDIPEWFP